MIVHLTPNELYYLLQVVVKERNARVKAGEAGVTILDQIIEALEVAK